MAPSPIVGSGAQVELDMAPSIGSLSPVLPGGRFGVVVGAQAVGEARDGRQLHALRIKTDEPTPAPKPASRAAPSDEVLLRLPGSDKALVRKEREPSILEDSRKGLDPAASKNDAELSDSERAALDRLRQRDQQVRQEEQAHAAIAGDLAGPISYTYQRGPDGRNYAVGGSVPLRVQTSGDPDEAARVGARLAAAAHGAVNPSGADLSAARRGYALQSQAALAEKKAGSLLDLQA